MAAHIAFIRQEVRKPFYRIMNDMNIDPDDDDDDDDSEDDDDDDVDDIISQKKGSKLMSRAVVLAVTVEVVNIVGQHHTIRRVFVRTNDSIDYVKLGWVINEDIDCCMICAKMFSLSPLNCFLSMGRHHCRACGNIICSNCIAGRSFVKDLCTKEPVIVCMQCYWGQDIVELCFSTATVVQTIELPSTKYTSFNQPISKLMRINSRAVGLMKMDRQMSKLNNHHQQQEQQQQHRLSFDGTIIL